MFIVGFSSPPSIKTRRQGYEASNAIRNGAELIIISDVSTGGKGCRVEEVESERLESNVLLPEHLAQKRPWASSIPKLYTSHGLRSSRKWTPEAAELRFLEQLRCGRS